MKKVFKIVLFSLLGLFVLWTFIFLWKKSQPKTVQYEIVQAQTNDIVKKTIATGQVEPRDEVLIKPQISGIISEILKKPGDKIVTGDVIAKVKVIPEMSNLSAAESRLKLAVISKERIEQEYTRQNKLYQSGVIAQKEFEDSKLEYLRAKEEVENAQESLDIIRNGISKKFAQYNNTEIRATISGMILDIPVKVGNSVIQSNSFNDGTTIASIANMGDMIFKGDVDETEVGKLSKGMAIRLSIGALQNHTFDAVLEYISPKGTESSGAVLFEIKAAAKIPDSIFVRAGYSANAEIITDKRTQVLTIPESIVEFVNDSAYVYLVKKEQPKQEFEKRAVKLGLSDGINIEVLSGVTLKDRLRGAEVSEFKTMVTTSR